ncbi:MAG: SpoIIE family protein phosphatase [Gemmatimonadetes bacterium]|nr:SpoIIE family protein phosphatase [Gemmatimonadota bacterium]MYG84248.1 SpoIIE family protein phosphatase [Gemmatimonadota bacterium]MYJ90550.1 SpoIIE family protein phosphatase [Gemmatimonadota bacterium]
MNRAARIAARIASRFGFAILRTLKRLAPDTWMKRCIYAGLVLAAGVFLVLGTWQGVVTWLGWPAIALLAAGVFYYTWKAFSWLRDHLLWKVRNRIIVVFLFAGIAPLCIASSISILVGWLWIGTLGTNLVTRHIEETVDRLDHIPVDLQLALLRTASENIPSYAGILDEILRDNQDLTGLSISVFEDGRPVLASAPFDTPEPLPDWLLREDHFAEVVFDSLSDGLSALSFRAGTAIDIRGRNLYVLSYKPLGEEYRTKIWEELGTQVAFRSGPVDFEEVTVYESPPSEVERSRLPLLGALHVPWAATFSVKSWNSGEQTVAILGLDLDPAHIFEATVTGDMLLSGFPPLFFVVIVLCAVFVCFELISFMIGLLVSRRITTAVHGLYEGTEAIRSGRTDFRVEEKARDQLGELGRSFNTMAQSIEILMDEEREKERIETELSMAREVQARFIPNVPPQRGPLELAGAWIPARTVSGDYYDFIEHRDRMLDIVVGDISGKGISAALMMAGLQASLRSQALDPALEGSPDRLSRLMSRLNVYLCHSTAPDRFATVFICSYHMETSRLNYCCAGHNPPLLLRNGSDNVALLESGGYPIGLFPEAEYEDSSVSVDPGDLFAVYTDGITDALNREEEDFGEARLHRVLSRNRDRSSEEILERILASVRDFSLGVEQFDDQTAVIGRVR